MITRYITSLLATAAVLVGGALHAETYCSADYALNLEYSDSAEFYDNGDYVEMMFNDAVYLVVAWDDEAATFAGMESMDFDMDNAPDFGEYQYMGREEMDIDGTPGVAYRYKAEGGEIQFAVLNHDGRTLVVYTAVNSEGDEETMMEGGESAWSVIESIKLESCSMDSEPEYEYAD